jgi:hypothetical protein
MADQYGNYTYGGNSGTPMNPTAPTAIPVGRAAGALSGVAQMQNIMHNAAAADRAKTEFDQQQGARKTGIDYTGHTASADPVNNPSGTTPPATPAVHPGFQTFLSGILGHLLGAPAGSQPPAAVPPPAGGGDFRSPAIAPVGLPTNASITQPPPAAYSRGGTVTARGAIPGRGRADPNRGSTGATYEPRLAGHDGTMPTWEAPRSAPGGDGGASAATGDQGSPPGDSPASQKILTMDDGGGVVGVTTPNSPNAQIPVPMSDGGAPPGPQTALDPRLMNIGQPRPIVGGTEAAAANTHQPPPGTTREPYHEFIDQMATHMVQAGLKDQVPDKGAVPPPSADAVPPAGAGPASASAGPPPAGGPPPAAGPAPGAAPPAAPPGGAPAGPPPNPDAAPGTNGESKTPQDQASQTALTTAAQKTQAAGGAPEQSPMESGKVAHSLTPEWFAENDRLMMKAVQAAQMAGHNPKEVLETLIATRNGFLQTGMLRNLSAASIAAQNGDQDALEKAMRNVYYYFPDGKDLTIKRQGGQVMYQDPFQPQRAKVTADGKPIMGKDGHHEQEPNFVPITAQHLQVLGQAMLDPMKVGTIINETLSSRSKIALETAEAEAKKTTAHGEEMKGAGYLARGQADLAKVASTNVKSLAEAQLAQAKAVTSGWALRNLQRNQRLDPTVLKGAQAAAGGMDDLFLGRKTSVPTTDPEGNPSLSPAAGKVVHDPKSVQKAFVDATPSDIAYSKGLAAGIYAANARGGMQPAQATDLAAQFHIRRNSSHPSAVNKGKQDPDVWVHADGRAGIWNPSTKKYDQIRIDPSAAAALDGGGMTSSDYVSLVNGANAGGAPGQGAARPPMGMDDSEQ